MPARTVVYNRLEYLTPDTRDRVTRFLALLKDAGYQTRIVETFRTQARQDALYKASTMTPSRASTHRRASWHTAGRAADIDITPAATADWQKFLSLAHSCGLATLEPFEFHHVQFIPAGLHYDDAITEYAALNLAPAGNAPRPGVLATAALSPGEAMAAVLTAFQLLRTFRG